MSTEMNRAARRAQQRRGRGKARTGLVAVATAASMGVALVGGAGMATADSPLDAFGDLGGITDMLDDPMIADFIEICQDADGSTPVPEDGDEVYAVVDCSQSTGTGIAVVLPESIEVGIPAEEMTQKLPLYGTRNLIQMASMLALNEYIGSPSYKRYEDVQRDAALDVDLQIRQVNGECKSSLFGVCYSWHKIDEEYDANLEKRTKALKVAQYLTGETYDYTEKVDLPGLVDPLGTATVAGPGIQLALAMGGGNAYAETGHELGVALAGASGGRDSSAYSFIGVASALNADTDKIGLTWFGKALDFDRLRGSALASLAGDDDLAMLDEIEGLKIPALKEVSCFGILATAMAEQLGECTNILGTFDYYNDLRPAADGEHRQTQYALTDITSLFFGPDALLKQLDGTSEETPFMDGLMDALTDEDVRLKFANDFLRLTRDVRSEVVMVQATDGEELLVDEDGEPIMVPLLDEDDQPVLRQVTATFLTSDYGLVEPVAIDWMGYRMVLFPAVEVNGQMRPNLLSLPQIEKILDGETDEGEDEDGEEKASTRSAGLRGLLPTISLVSVKNPFGLGTLTLDKPLDPQHTWNNFRETVTIDDDLKTVGDLAGGLLGSSGSTGSTEPDTPGPTEDTTGENTGGDEGQTGEQEQSTSGGDGDAGEDETEGGSMSTDDDAVLDDEDEVGDVA